MKNRQPHIIRKNKSTIVPEHLIFFDTETYEHKENDETKLLLRLGVACYWRRRGNISNQFEWLDFSTIEQFWNFVFSKVYKGRKLYLVAHNISFDFRVLAGFKNMKLQKYKTHKLLYNGTTNIWEFRKNNMSICILDNMNYFKSSLDVLGNSIGVRKLEIDFNNISNKLLSLYCRTDVLIMIKAWILLFNFIKENNLGNFSKTIAGQALNSYKHRFMEHNIFIHTNSNIIELERNSYHGGRTECFFIGKAPKENYYLLDVNSMYSSVMKNYLYPTKLLSIELNISISHLIQLLKEYCVIAKVLVNCSQPIFPVKNKGKLIFPIGTFITYLSSRELIYALEHNLIQRIDIAAVYNAGQLFTTYVNFFYNKRQQYKNENNEAFAYICKLFLNSLYGKFGQRNEYYEKIGENDNLEDGIFEYFDIEKSEFIKERVINGTIERSLGFIEGNDIFVAIPAHITADARMKLWNYFLIAGRENISYCDTDSLIVNKTGYNNCKKYIDSDIGMLSLKEMSDNLKIYGAKDYEFGNEIIIKGIKKDAIKENENTFIQTKFEGMAGAIRNKRPNEMFISEVKKILKREYDKGTVNTAGFITPFELNEI